MNLPTLEKTPPMTLEEEIEEIAVSSNILLTSPDIGELTEALAKAQNDTKLAEKDGINPHFKSAYNTLASSVRVGSGPASKNGLAVIQGQGVANGELTVTTLLSHKSNQWVKNILRVPIHKYDIHTIKSTVTYCRRMGYDGILMIASTDDDDGNAGAKDFSQEEIVKRKESKKLRAKINKAFGKCKKMAELEKTARTFKGNTYEFWKIKTFHNDKETFGDVYLTHKDRIGNQEALYTEEGHLNWRKKIFDADAGTLMALIETFGSDSKRQTDENEQALQARAQDLGMWDEHNQTFQFGGEQ